jgi:hypothetical protein
MEDSENSDDQTLLGMGEVMPEQVNASPDLLKKLKTVVKGDYSNKVVEGDPNIPGDLVPLGSKNK